MQSHNSPIKLYLNVKSTKAINNYGLQIFNVPVYSTNEFYALPSQKKKEKEGGKKYYDVLNSLGSVISFSLLSNELTVLPSSQYFPSRKGSSSHRFF